MLYWLEFNSCVLNVDGEAILLLSNPSVMAWACDKLFRDGYYFITLKTSILYFVFRLS